MDHERRILQLGADPLQIGADLVAVARVVDHDEQDRLLAELLVLGGALPPFLDAELQIVGVALGDDRTLLLGELRAAGGVGKDRVLDDVLSNRLDERIVAHGLNEDGAGVVPGRRRDVDLNREAPVLLQELVVDVLNGLEPRKARVVDVVRFVVEDGKFLDLADDLAEVGVAVGGRANGPVAERGEEIVAQVVVFERWLRDRAEIDAMDVGQEDVADRPDDPHVVLNVQSDLKIVAPVPPGKAVVGQHRIVEEEFQAVEIRAKAVEHDDVRGDEKEVAGEVGVRLIELVEIAPRDQERQDLGLAGAGRHFQDETRPRLVEHVRRDGARGVEADQVVLVADPSHVEQPDDRFDRFALGEIVAELRLRSVRLFDPMIGLEPPAQKVARGRRGPRIGVGAPRRDLVPDVGDERRKKLFVSRAAGIFGRGKPADAGQEDVVRGSRKVRVQGHVAASSSRVGTLRRCETAANLSVRPASESRLEITGTRIVSLLSMPAPVQTAPEAKPAYLPT